MWGWVQGEYLTRRVREDMFAAVLRQEVAWFDRDENSSGAITARSVPPGADRGAASTAQPRPGRLPPHLAPLAGFPAALAIC